MGKNAQSNLPQDVVNRVDRWCLMKKMRQNVKKCKNMKTAGLKISIKLNDTPLEQVTVYKYLGIELNIDLNWDSQWQRVQKLISHQTTKALWVQRGNFNNSLPKPRYQPFHLQCSNIDLHKCKNKRRVQTISKQHITHNWHLTGKRIP